MTLKTPSKNILLGLAAVLLTTLLLYLCLLKIDLAEFLKSIRQVQIHYLFLGACFTLAILFLSAFQFKIFLPPKAPISFFRMFQIVSIFSMTVSLVPFWGGHALFVYLVGKREKIGASQALSALTLEQISDGMAKLAVFTGMALLLPFPDWMQKGIESLVLLVLGAYLLVFYFAFRYRNLNQNKDFAPVGWRKLFHFAAHWAYHLHALRSVPKSLAGFALALGIKLCEVMAIWMVQKSLGVDFSFPRALLMAAALAIATTLPLTPGRVGLFEATAILIYQYLGLEASKAFALGIFIHVVHTVPFLVVGYLNSILMGFKPLRNLEEIAGEP